MFKFIVKIIYFFPQSPNMHTIGPIKKRALLPEGSNAHPKLPVQLPNLVKQTNEQTKKIGEKC